MGLLPFQHVDSLTIEDHPHLFPLRQHLFLRVTGSVYSSCSLQDQIVRIQVLQFLTVEKFTELRVDLQFPITHVFHGSAQLSHLSMWPDLEFQTDRIRFPDTSKFFRL